MADPAPTPISKLPHIGTNIFTHMSALAQEHQAINLSQGFPDFSIDPQLIKLVEYYMNKGHNQYAPMPGVPELRQAIAQKLNKSGQTPFDPHQEITITAGATEGLYSALTALINHGDEVIIFDPSYDLYAPVVALCGASAIHVELSLPNFEIDWSQLESRVTDRTKAIIINNPNNPAGSIMPLAELERLSELVVSKNLILFSDEVYEHMVFDGLQHHSILSLPKLRQRGVAFFSFGKTFHTTGWKTGYCVAPALLTKEIRKVHQFVAFSTVTPIQYALADYVKEPQNYLQLAGFFEDKRNLFLELMKPSRFTPLPCQGTYFQLMSYQNVSDLGDFEMAEWMTTQQGVACIPISVFYERGTDHGLLRFCFAKSTETLKIACEQLCKI